MALDRDYYRTQQPILITFGLESDAPLRAWIRGDLHRSQSWPSHSVIVQGWDEAYRIVTAMANLKIARQKSYGGCICVNWNR